MHILNFPIDVWFDYPSSVFRGLTQKERESVSENHALLNTRKGEAIYLEGEKAKGIGCLASGKAKVFRIGVGGREQILRMIRPGDIFGLSSLFSDNLWHESATAIEDSSVCILDKSPLIRMLRRNPDVALRITKLLALELHSSDTRMVSLTQKHVRGRIAESLLSLRDIYGFEKDNMTLGITISRQDIAHYSNMTTSNAIRTLSNMAAEGIIELKGKRIIILDNSMLEHISGTG